MADNDGISLAAVAEDCPREVARRVRAGGHAVQPEIVVRRYWAGLRNLRALYLPLADVAAIYDNAGETPILIAERIAGTDLLVRDTARWKLIEGAST
jgi:predicted ABC-type ATPase